MLKLTKLLMKLTGQTVGISDIIVDGKKGKNGKTEQILNVEYIENLLVQNREQAIELAVKKAGNSKNDLDLKGVIINNELGVKLGIEQIEEMKPKKAIKAILKSFKDSSKVDDIEKNPLYISLKSENDSLKSDLQQKQKESSETQKRTVREKTFSKLYKSPEKDKYKVVGVKNKEDRKQNMEGLFYNKFPHDFIDNEWVPINKDGTRKVHEDTKTDLTSKTAFKIFLSDSYDKNKKSVDGSATKAEKQAAAAATNQGGNGNENKKSSKKVKSLGIENKSDYEDYYNSGKYQSDLNEDEQNELDSIYEEMKE